MKYTNFKHKKIKECPTKCSHPNIDIYGNIGGIPTKIITSINKIKASYKSILYCGHCDTVWVEFAVDDTNLDENSEINYKLVKIHDMQKLKDVWVYKEN